MKIIICLMGCLVVILEEYFVPLLILTVRLWMAKILIYCGITKLLTWSSVPFLFAYEYKLPLLGSVFWAVLATASDFVSAALIGMGFLTRLASFQMLVVTTAIYVFYHQFSEYYLWVIALSTLILFGAGFFSLDTFLFKKDKECDEEFA